MTNRFAKTCLIALLAFALANVASLVIRSDGPDDPDSRERYGFPVLISDRIVETSGGVAFYPEGPYQHYSYAALWGDVAIALVGSVLIASVRLQVATKPKRIE
jgi:hypothetical protein